MSIKKKKMSENPEIICTLKSKDIDGKYLNLYSSLRKNTNLTLEIMNIHCLIKKISM